MPQLEEGLVDERGGLQGFGAAVPAAPLAPRHRPHLRIEHRQQIAGAAALGFGGDQIVEGVVVRHRWEIGGEEPAAPRQRRSSYHSGRSSINDRELAPAVQAAWRYSAHDCHAGPPRHGALRPSVRRTRCDDLDLRQGRGDAALFRIGAACGRGLGAVLPAGRTAQAAHRTDPAARLDHRAHAALAGAGRGELRACRRSGGDGGAADRYAAGRET